MLPTISLLGLKVSCTDPISAKDQICQWVKEKEPVYVCVAPAATLVDARRDPAYRNVVNDAAMVTPDGMPVVWLAKLKGCKSIARTYGPDLMRSLCATAGIRHYFFGSTDMVVKALRDRLTKDYPSIEIAGMLSPPFRLEAELEDEATLKAINDARPDILWVGLGSPKQDHWMALNRNRLQVPVMVGIGAAFDFLAGTKPQAPRWMGQCGLEWLFRLCSEPKRLWRRYLLGNTLFIVYAIEDLLTTS